MREIRTSGSEGGGTELNRSFLPLSAHDPIVTAMKAICLQLGIGRPVTLLIHPDKTIPVVWGILRCRLMLPAAARQWSDEQLQSVLLHELAHIKRRDTIVQLLTQVACALHWFNPLVWFAAWRLDVERERSCDDLVLASGIRPSAYAGHLLDVVTGLSPARWTQACGLAMARQSSLEGRLTAVLGKDLNRRGVSVALAGLALTIAVGIAVPIAMLRAAMPTPNLTGKLAPETVAKLKWGEPVNGLRMALAYPPALGDALLGKKPHFELVVQNVSEKEVHFLASDEARNPRRLLIREGERIVQGLSDPEVSAADWKLQPGQCGVLRLYTKEERDEAGTIPSSGIESDLSKIGRYHAIVQMEIAKAPTGAWTGKLVTGQTRGSADVAVAPAPMHKDARAYYEVWQRYARANGDISGALVGELAAAVKTFIRYNPTWETVPKLNAILPRLDATHDWKPADAIALLDEVAGIQDSPLKPTPWRGTRHTIRQGEALPKKFADAPWGEAQPNGLRAAWVLEPGAVEHRIGAALKARLLVQNTGRVPVVLQVPTFHQGGVKATDAKGAEVQVSGIFWTTLATLAPVRLGPGEHIEINTPGVGLGPRAGMGPWAGPRVGSNVLAKPGDELTLTHSLVRLDGSEVGVSEHDPHVSGPGWWLAHIKGRLNRELPLPADAAERTRMLDRAVRELFATAPSAEETAAFIADKTPDALDALAKRLVARVDVVSFSGKLPTASVKFRVLAADANADKQPRVVLGPGEYPLPSATATRGDATLKIVGRPVGDRRTNDAQLLFEATEFTGALPPDPHKLEAPDGWGTWAIVCRPDSDFFYLLSKGTVRKIDYSKPRNVTDTPANDLPAEFRDEVKRILDIHEISAAQQAEIFEKPAAPAATPDSKTGANVPAKPTASGTPKLPKLPDEDYTKTGIHCQKFREEDAKRPGGELMGDVAWNGERPLEIGLRVAKDAKWNIGGQVRVDLVIRNLGGSDLKFTQTPRTDNGLSVVAIDKDGKEYRAEFAQIEIDRLLVLDRLLLPAFHTARVKSFTLRFDPEKRGVSERDVAAFHLPPGKYKLRCKWNDARPDFAHEGEWTGELVKEELEFTLAGAVTAQPTSEAPKTTEKKPFTAWGEEVNGVQIGVRLGEQRIYEVGENVTLILRLRNNGKVQVPYRYGDEYFLKNPPLITDASGKAVTIKAMSVFGKVLLKSVAPGKEVDLVQLKLDLRPATDRSKDAAWTIYGTGKFQIQFPVADVVGEVPLGLPGMKFTTGKLELEVKEPFTAWGKEIGVLQAGLGFKAGGKRAFSHGEKVKLVVRVRNVGKEEAKFDYIPEHFIENPPTVLDEKAKAVSLAPGLVDTGVQIGREANLAPGKEIELAELTLEFSSRNEAGDGFLKRLTIYGTGKFHVGFENVLGTGFIKPDPAMSKLATGKLELEVKEPEKLPPEKEPFTAWGEEVNGVQIGVQLGEQRTYEVGENVTLILRLRNNGKVQVPYRYGDEYFLKNPPLITDASGKAVTVKAMSVFGSVRLESVAPGKEVDLVQLQLDLRPATDRSKDAAWTIYGTGKFQIQYPVTGVVGEVRPDLLGMKLTTGKLELEVKEPFTAWGKEVGGVQAGLGFKAGEKRAYTHGEWATLVARVRNVGKEEVKFQYLRQFFVEQPPTVFHEKGELKQLGRVDAFGEHIPVEVKLAAGKEIELYELKLYLGTGSEEGIPKYPYIFGTGKFQVQYEKVLGNSSSGLIKLDPALSKLATGKLELEIKPAAPVQPAKGKWPQVRQRGEWSEEFLAHSKTVAEARGTPDAKLEDLIAWGVEDKGLRTGLLMAPRVTLGGQLPTRMVLRNVSNEVKELQLSLSLNRLIAVVRTPDGKLLDVRKVQLRGGDALYMVTLKPGEQVEFEGPPVQFGMEMDPETKLAKTPKFPICGVSTGIGKVLVHFSVEAKTGEAVVEVVSGPANRKDEKPQGHSEKGALLKPATEQKLKWGEPVNGLRMALAWPPTLGEASMGDGPDFYLVVQNVSQAAVRLTTGTAAPNPRRLNLMRRLNPNDETILSSRTVDDVPVPGDWLLQPRESALVRLIHSHEKMKDGRTFSAVKEHIVSVQPQYSYTADMTVEKAPAGAWTGKLTTGETRGSADVPPPKSGVPLAEQTWPMPPWGAEKDGLSAGIRIIGEARIGGEVKAELWLRNSGAKDVTFSQCPRADFGLHVVAQDKDGKEHAADITQFRGKPGFHRLLLPAGNIVKLKEFTMTLGAKKDGERVNLDLPPGEYKLRAVWSDTTSRVAPEGEWTGKLTTGEVDLKIAAANAGGDAAKPAAKPPGANMVKVPDAEYAKDGFPLDDLTGEGVMWSGEESGLSLGYRITGDEWRILGKELKVELWVRNAGKEDVKFQILRRTDEGLRVKLTGKDGKEHFARMVPSDVLLFGMKHLLSPGQCIKVNDFSVGLLPPEQNAQIGNELRFFVPSGWYQLVCEVKVPGFTATGGDRKKTVPGAGEWTGTITTRSLNVEVVASDAPAPRPRVESADVALDKDGTIFLNGKKVTLDELKTKAAKDAKKRFTIRADKDVPYTKVIEVVEALKAAGVVEFSFSKAQMGDGKYRVANRQANYEFDGKHHFSICRPSEYPQFFTVSWPAEGERPACWLRTFPNVSKQTEGKWAVVWEPGTNVLWWVDDSDVGKMTLTDPARVIVDREGRTNNFSRDFGLPEEVKTEFRRLGFVIGRDKTPGLETTIGGNTGGQSIASAEFGAWSIKGTVTDADGKPLANVPVHVNTNQELKTEKTDAKGEYRAYFSLPLELFAHWRAVTVEPVLEGFTERDMAKSGEFNVLLRAGEQPQRVRLADDKDFQPGPIPRFAENDLLPSQPGVSPGNPGRADFVMLKAGEITGEIVTADGKPAPPQWIAAATPDQRPGHNAAIEKSDAQGHFRLKGIPTNKPVIFTVTPDRKPGETSKSSEQKFEQAREHKLRIALPAEGSGNRTQVFGKDDKPISPPDTTSSSNPSEK